jgi:hypothetical protein
MVAEDRRRRGEGQKRTKGKHLQTAWLGLTVWRPRDLLRRRADADVVVLVVALGRPLRAHGQVRLPPGAGAAAATAATIVLGRRFDVRRRAIRRAFLIHGLRCPGAGARATPAPRRW